jgi:hypothetical protein
VSAALRGPCGLFSDPAFLDFAQGIEATVAEILLKGLLRSQLCGGTKRTPALGCSNDERPPTVSDSNALTDTNNFLLPSRIRLRGCQHSSWGGSRRLSISAHRPCYRGFLFWYLLPVPCSIAVSIRPLNPCGLQLLYLPPSLSVLLLAVSHPPGRLF